MILCWLGGDTFKAAFYSEIKAPIQLILCASFQISIDVLIMWQFWLYKKDIPRQDIAEEKKLKKEGEMREFDTITKETTTNEEPLQNTAEYYTKT